MKITAITRYKHGELYEILKRIGWSQSELARRTDLRVDQIGRIINLVRRPTVEQADSIQKAVGTAGEYLDVLAEWPETFEGLERGFKREETAEVELETLIGNREAMMLPSPETEDTTGLDSTLDQLLSELTPNEQTVIKNRFWNGLSYEQTAKKIHRSKDRARQIEIQAIHRLRHPRKIQKLAEHLITPPLTH